MVSLEMQNAKIPSAKTCDIEKQPHLKEAQVGLLTVNTISLTPAPGDEAPLPGDVFGGKEGISKFGAMRQNA